MLLVLQTIAAELVTILALGSGFKYRIITNTTKIDYD